MESLMMFLLLCLAISMGLMGLARLLGLLFGSRGPVNPVAAPHRPNRTALDDDNALMTRRSNRYLDDDDMESLHSSSDDDLFTSPQYSHLHGNIHHRSDD